MLPKYGKIPQYLFEFPKCLKEWNISFQTSTNKTSHLEQPSIENVSFNKDLAKLYFAILTFKHLKYVTTLLSFVTFLLINITGLRYAK